jgi:alkylation response protein AidB-like acyl-CoA dehydrogenase
MAGPPLAIDAALLDGIAARAASSEARGELGSETVAALNDAGIFRALVPAALGGGEVTPLEFRVVVERIAAADGAAGWCAAIGATAGLAAAYLPDDQARQLFATDPRPPITAGVFAPRGRLTKTGDQQFELSGRWPLGSGVGHSAIVGLGCLDPERGPLYALVPRAEVEIIETWDSLGLRATASHDVGADAVSIPAERVIDLVGGTPIAGGTLYSFPLFGLLAVAVSAVCTGIARGALADLIALATQRKPAGSTRSVAERATAQEAVAGAVASLRAAKSGVDAAIDRAWTVAERGEPLGLDERAGLRLASTHAAQTAVGVVDAAHRLGGAGSLYRGNPLERRLRDVHTAAQHMVVAQGTMELAGRVLLGFEVNAAQL